MMPATQIFQYPRQAHVRRHGPLGYVNYQSYKPWLRDEFEFRCVYCLWRERWRPWAKTLLLWTICTRGPGLPS
jgi:hypothetical protein